MSVIRNLARKKNLPVVSVASRMNQKRMKIQGAVHTGTNATMEEQER